MAEKLQSLIKASEIAIQTVVQSHSKVLVIYERSNFSPTLNTF